MDSSHVYTQTITLQREGDDHSPSLALEDITGIFKGDEAASHAPVAAETQPDHTRLLGRDHLEETSRRLPSIRFLVNSTPAQIGPRWRR